MLRTEKQFLLETMLLKVSGVASMQFGCISYRKFMVHILKIICLSSIKRQYDLPKT